MVLHLYLSIKPIFCQIQELEVTHYYPRTLPANNKPASASSISRHVECNIIFYFAQI